jgi:hypothetical protein
MPLDIEFTFGRLAVRPNCQFNADANTGHGFAIFMASVAALCASRSGTAYGER